MKRALFFAFFLALPCWASAGDAPIDPQAGEAEVLNYRVRSSATELEAPPEAFRVKEIVTREGKGLWTVHELDSEEAPHDCSSAGAPDAMDYIDEP